MISCSTQRAGRATFTAGRATLSWVLCCALLLTAVPALAEDLTARAVEALVQDIRKLVAAQEDMGWKIDAYEIEDLMPDALVSVCRTSEAVRRQALGRLDRRIAELGGPLQEAFAQTGSIDELGELVTATRQRDLLAEALLRAPAQCPLWLAPDPEFRGIQTDAHRFTLTVEAGGILLAQVSGGRRDIGGGGSGRLLLLYGLDHSWSLLGGAELGGSALFQRGEETTQFPLQFQLAAPLVLRHHLLTFHHDLELAPLFFFTEDDTRLSYGVRMGGLLGLSTFRIRGIIPWAGLGLAFEYLFKSAYRPQVAALKGGARAGFDWDF